VGIANSKYLKPVSLSANKSRPYLLLLERNNDEVSQKDKDIQMQQRILNGDQIAFREFYHAHQKWFFLTCLRYVNNRADAQDLLQDAFVAIHRDLKQFNADKGELKYWARKVVVNVCLQKLRKKSPLNAFEELSEIKETLTTTTNAIDNLSMKELLALIVRLPKGYRTIFNLYVIDGYNHREIAELLGISSNTSKTQLMKARKLLQSKIGTTEQITRKEHI